LFINDSEYLILGGIQWCGLELEKHQQTTNEVFFFAALGIL
jgi:hypothetical protein